MFLCLFLIFCETAFPVFFTAAARARVVLSNIHFSIAPIDVVIPRHTDDIHAVLELANRRNVPVLPRGGGTSLTGQTVNYAVVLDYSVHLNRVLEVNREELWARVEPGVVQDVLNQHMKHDGLLFGPDTSTSSRATLGGMIGNNSG